MDLMNQGLSKAAVSHAFKLEFLRMARVGLGLQVLMPDFSITSIYLG